MADRVKDDSRSIEITKRVLQQGQALVRVMEGGEIIDHTGLLLEQGLVWLLLKAYQHRLRMIVRFSPDWLAEETLSTSEHIGTDRQRFG